MSAHAHLKKATRAAHDRVDAAFARYDLSDATDYGRFLQRHAAAFLPAEQALTDAGAGTLIDGWNDNLRGSSLIADLTDIGLAVPAFGDVPVYESEAEILGGAYVLEGSRLGGTVLRRSVGAGFPRRFLDSVQPQGRWRTFIAQLNQRLYDRSSIDRATKSALETFALFESAGAGRD